MSICCFCMKQVESSQHIMLECEVTINLWNWLSKETDFPLDCSNCLSLIMGSIGRGSNMVQHVINFAVIHTIWAIWIERNQRCFQNKYKPMSSLFNCILSEVKLSYTLVLAKCNSDMKDYKISRLFNIPFQTKRITVRKDVHWCPPPHEMTKFNCDGSSIGMQPCGAIGIVIRTPTSFLGAICSNIGYATTLEAEFSTCMRAIEKAKELHLHAIILETDSLKVVSAFNNNVGIPWQMRA